MKTLSELWDESFPKANRFMVSFDGKYPLLKGGECSQAARRFRLADSASDALENVLAELNKTHAVVNRFENVRVQHVPEAACYTLGYFRFQDIRKKTLTK